MISCERKQAKKYGINKKICKAYLKGKKKFDYFSFFIDKNQVSHFIKDGLK